jgi:hypothetical protein
LDTFEDQEEQAPNQFRSCQIGACFACGLGGGNTHTIEWQSSRPNPLPLFEFPDEFYTPILLPGMYLPVDMLEIGEIYKGITFYTLKEPELANHLAAFFSHEVIHRHLLAGIVSMLMRLIGSRSYALLAYLIRGGFKPSLWNALLSQCNTLANLCNTTAPSVPI